MKTLLPVFVALSGFTAVLMGAAAAHWLGAVMEPQDILRVEKAATYQMYHTLALLAVVVGSRKEDSRIYRWPSLGFISGILLFSGSLYAYSFTQIGWLRHIAPFGGVAFMLGWLSLARALLLPHPVSAAASINDKHNGS